MPRYFFDTLDGEHVIDHDGEVLEDRDAARQAAIRVVSELTPSRAPHLWDGEILEIVVRDEEKTIGILTVQAKVAG